LGRIFKFAFKAEKEGHQIPNQKALKISCKEIIESLLKQCLDRESDLTNI